MNNKADENDEKNQNSELYRTKSILENAIEKAIIIHNLFDPKQDFIKRKKGKVRHKSLNKKIPLKKDIMERKETLEHDSPNTSEDQQTPSKTNNEKNNSYYHKWKNAVQEFELEKATRIEAEIAFKNLRTLYEEKHAKLLRAGASSKQAFDIASQMKKNYEELRLITENNETKLKDANDTIDILEQLLTAERRKADILKYEKRPPKQTEPTINPLSEELEIEQREKENALQKIREQCEQIKEIENEREANKKKCKEMKEKMVEILKINTELGVQNEILEKQRNSFKCLLHEKDAQINRFLEKDVLENPRVVDKIKCIEENFKKHVKVLTDKVATINREIADMSKKNVELKGMVDSRNLYITKLCRNHESLKRTHDAMLDRFEAEVAKNENDVLELLEATKTIKNELIELKHKNKDQEQEIAKLKEIIQGKDTDIAVLTEVRYLYEDKIIAYQCETDSLREVLKKCKSQIENNQLATSKLELCMSVFQTLLKDARYRLEKEMEARMIQEKILEDSKDTVKMLRMKLKECCHQKYKCEREKEILLVERDHC